MNNTEKINFRQSRDFGETFNVSVKFIRQNFKLFFKSLALIAGPFVLISAVAGAFYQSSSIGLLSLKGGFQENYFSQFGLTFAIFIFASVIANLMLIGTTFAYMITYMEKGTGNFTIADISSTLLKNIGKIILTFLAMFLILVLLFALVIGLIALMATMGAAFAILVGFILFIGILIMMPPLIWQLSVIYLVAMQENSGAFQSFNRTREVMRDNYWWTWVIVVCAGMAVGLASLVFTMPQMIYQMVIMFSHFKPGAVNEGVSIPFIIVSTICTFCSTLLYSTLYIISGFHYYSLAEQKDGIGLMERIDEIGNTPDNNVEQHY
ncbi:MAG: hypothetical protein V4608_06560 [Bacteroidota bacterium]